MAQSVLYSHIIDLAHAGPRTFGAYPRCALDETDSELLLGEVLFVKPLARRAS